MAVIETLYRQDLQEAVKVHYLDGNLFSNNGNGNKISVELYNGGEPLTSITGTVSGYVVVSDGTTVPCTGSKSGNRASILIPAAAYQPGNVFISVFLTDVTTVTTLAAVSTTVLQTRTGTQVDPGSVVTDWTQTINAAMQAVEDAADNLGGIIAVPYASITFPVPLGKYTYYNDNLYRCISPIASIEDWTAAHWTQVKLADDVSDLKSAFGAYLEVDFTNLFNKDTATGSRRINTNTGEAVSADAQFAVSDYIPVTSGKEYIINFSYYSSSNYGMAFYNSSKTYVSGRKQSNSTTTSTDDFVFTVPEGVSYIRISCALGTLSIDDIVVSLNNGTISQRFNIEDLLGENIKPLYKTAYEFDSASVKTFNGCELENAHRYTVVKQETTSRAVSTIGCIKSGAFAGSSKFDYKNPCVTSFTTTNSGSLAASVNGYPVSGVLSVFDTTGDDSLKEYLEKLYAIPGEETNLLPSKSMRRIIAIETGNYNDSKVIFVGDSQTQRNTFTSAFKTLYAVNNNESDVDYYGYGGAGAREIAGFQGGVTLFAKPFTIPATTTAVEIELYTDTEPGHACAKQSVKGLTDIEIGGVIGDISYNSNEGKNYFTRDASGDAVVIDRPIIVRSSLSYLTHSTLIVEVGTNDTTGETEETLSNMLKSVIRSMVRYNATGQYIVLGLTAKVENLDVSSVNNALAEEFGDHFIDDRTYLIEYGLEDEEITPTAQDITDIANGEIPSSLRDDAIHFNQHGGNVIGKLIYDRGKILGYWK